MREVARKTGFSFECVSGSSRLILDQSGNEKAGKKSVEVARQYIGNVGKVCNAQVGVFAALARRKRVALVAGKLYLPREWTMDAGWMTAASLPKAEQKYRTKPELAAELIEQLPEELGDDCGARRHDLRQFAVVARQIKATRQSLCAGGGRTIKGLFKRPAAQCAKASGRRSRKKTGASGQQSISGRIATVN